MIDLFPDYGDTRTEFSLSADGEIRFVDWGDGNVSDDTTQEFTHKYKIPGRYTVATNSCEDGKIYFDLCVDPLVPEEIEFSTIPSTIEAGQYGLFTLSLTSSNSRETVSFYASGSDSNPHNVDVGFWDHLSPRWAFSTGAGEGFMESSEITGSPILDEEDQTIGYSFDYPFYFKDDMPGYPVIFATIDRGRGVNSRVYAAGEVNIIPTVTTSIKITEDGLVPINPTQYAGVPIPYVISVHDQYGNMMHYRSGSIHSVSLEGSCSTIETSAVPFSAEIPSVYDNCFKVGGYVLSALTLDFDAISSIHYETIKDECDGEISLESFRPKSYNTKIKVAATVHGNYIEGESDGFNLYPFEEYYKIRRQGESEDLSETIKHYSFTDRMRGFESLWEYSDAILGKDINSLGTKTLFGIERFADQHSNVDRCNIKSIIDLSTQYGVDIDEYDLSFSDDIKRIIELAALPLEKITGSKCMCNMNFSRCGDKDFIIKCNYCGNETSNTIGSQINLEDNIEAGESILFSEMGGEVFEVFHVLEQDGESTYPLKELSGIDVDNNCFYRWEFTQKGKFIESEIDYYSDGSTISPELSSSDDWYKEGGIIEELLTFNLIRGLGLDDVVVSTPQYIQYKEIPDPPYSGADEDDGYVPPQEWDEDALIYISRVEEKDGESLEPEVAAAINSLFTGFKLDGIWDNLTAGQALLFAGPRTVEGALVPIRSNMPNPTNFSMENYNRRAMVGYADSSAHIMSNLYASDAAPDNNPSLSVWVSSEPDPGPSYYNIYSSMFYLGRAGSGAGRYKMMCNNPSQIWETGDPNDSNILLGFWGLTRGKSESFSRLIGNGANMIGGSIPAVPISDTEMVSYFSGSGGGYSDGGLRWVQFGKNINLIPLRDRLKTYFNTIDNLGLT